jgi:predicted O-methyltransferase YrrM
MNLQQLYDSLKDRSDKGTTHDYISSYYNERFTPLKDASLSLLEIGVQEGYSMDLWRAWFTRAQLYAIELDEQYRQRTVERINNTFANAKAYMCDGFHADTLSLFEDNSLDYIIEDGPHTLETQIFTAQLWTKKLKPGGVLIIEDIQSPDCHCNEIIKSIENNNNLSARVFDFRNNKHRYDDVIVEITKQA